MQFLQRFLKLWKYWPWILLGSAALVFFTILKVPDAKLKGLIQGHLNQALYQSGISMTAAESNLSFIFGPRYTMKQVQVRWTPDSPPVVFDEIRVAPSVWSLMLGRLSGKATITAQKGTLTVSGHLTGNRFGADLAFHSMDIGKAGLLKALAKIEATALVDGDLHLGRSARLGRDQRHLDLNAAPCPFAGIVDQIADHVLEVLPLAAKPQSRFAGG